MGPRARQIFCLALYGALAQIMCAAELRADEQWRWTPASGEASARAWVPAKERADLALSITFPAARGCYAASLMLSDAEGNVLPSKQVTLTADGERFVLSPAPGSGVGVYEAPPPVFHALKRSRSLRLATVDAEYVFSLGGSADAINSAWKACEQAVQAEKAGDTTTEAAAAPKAQTDGIVGDALEERSIDDAQLGGSADRARAEPLVSGASVRRTVLPIIVLMFAVGNAFLTLDVLAKAFSLPAVSPPAGGQLLRGAALVGAVGWIVLPLIFYAAYGLLGAVLAMAGYLTAGLLIAAVIKPSSVQRGARRFIDWVRDLRLRGQGARRGSRLIVDGYRRAARRQGVAPTEKTTDAEILKLFERVGSAFKSVSYQRGESLQGPQLNYIVWKLIQAHEALGDDAFEAYLQQELRKYRDDGLPAAYRNELRL